MIWAGGRDDIVTVRYIRREYVRDGPVRLERRTAGEVKDGQVVRVMPLAARTVNGRLKRTMAQRDDDKVRCSTLIQSDSCAARWIG